MAENADGHKPRAAAGRTSCGSVAKSSSGTGALCFEGLMPSLISGRNARADAVDVPASLGCEGGTGTALGWVPSVAARGVVFAAPRGDRSPRCLRLRGAGAATRGVIAVGPERSRALSAIAPGPAKTARPARPPSYWRPAFPSGAAPARGASVCAGAQGALRRVDYR